MFLLRFSSAARLGKCIQRWEHSTEPESNQIQWSNGRYESWVIHNNTSHDGARGILPPSHPSHKEEEEEEERRKSNTWFAYDFSMINISLKERERERDRRLRGEQKKWDGEWLYRVWWKARRGLAIDIFNSDYMFTHIFKSNHHELMSLVCDVYEPCRPTCFFFITIITIIIISDAVKYIPEDHQATDSCKSVLEFVGNFLELHCRVSVEGAQLLNCSVMDWAWIQISHWYSSIFFSSLPWKLKPGWLEWVVED